MESYSDLCISNDGNDPFITSATPRGYNFVLEWQEPFTYDRHLVGENEIRVIHILPAGHMKSNLHCRMRYHSLNGSSMSENGPPYQALSYTWASAFSPGHGVAPPSQRPDEQAEKLYLIDIDGCKLPITESLDSALRHLRLPDQGLVLWVDAICIDQTHDEEKSAQVKQMKKIYEQAASVIVWLGPSAQCSDKAMDTLQAMLNFARRSPGYPGSISNVPPPNTAQERVEHAVANAFDKLFSSGDVSFGGIPDFPTNILFGGVTDFPIIEVSALLRRAWWGRAWVLQELAVSTRVIFACGSKRIEDGHECFHLFVSSWDNKARHSGQGPWVLDHRSWTMMGTHEAYTKMRDIESQLSSYDGESQLSELPSSEINISNKSKGIKSLKFLKKLTGRISNHHHDFQQSKPLNSKEDKLNYWKEILSLKFLLREAAYGDLETTRPQDSVFALLGLASDGKELGIDINYELPYQEIFIRLATAYLEKKDLWFLSYCMLDPPEDGPKLPTWVPDWSRGDGYKRILPFRVNLSFNTSRGHKMSYKLGSRGKDYQQQLKMSSVIVDTIDWVSDRRPRAFSNDLNIEIRADIICWLWEVVSVTKDRAQTCWALVAGVEPLSLRDKEEKLEKRRLLVEEAFAWMVDPSSRPNAETKARAETYFNYMMGTTNWRRVFRTTTGHIGLGSGFMKEGDEVVVFLGAEVPFVVRKVPREGKESCCHQIVGEAYVHNIMQGEIFEKKPKIEKIILE